MGEPRVAVTPARVAWTFYRRLHFAYAMNVLLLIATGLFIQMPDMRASVLGGHGRLIATIHEWSGVGMLVLPLLAVMRSPRWALNNIRRHSRRTSALRVHAVHLWFTLLTGLLFVVTGLAMWFQRSLPDAIVDPSIELHSIFSYALYAAVVLHVVSVRKRLFRMVWKPQAEAREELAEPPRAAVGG